MSAPRREQAAQVAAGAAPLLVYLLTLAPTVTLEDSGSFIVAAQSLGVAHPSGYPLWCLLAHPFTWLPLGSVAWRVHLSSAVFAAGACWLTYLLARRLTGSRAAALAGALALAFSRVFWAHAVVAEVYTLNALFAALLLLLALRARETGEPGRLQALALASGLALANHTIIALVVPVAWLWALGGRARAAARPRTLAACAALFVAGLAVYLYLPLRARTDPPVNWGDPRTLAATWRHVRRADYLAAAEQARYLGGPRDIVLHALDGLRQTASALTWPLAAIATAGLGWLWRRRRGFAAASLALVVLHVVALNLYTRARFTPFWSFEHRVFYIPVHLVAAVWLAGGVAWLRERSLARGARGAPRPASLPGAPAWFVVAACAVAAVPLIWNFRAADRRGDRRGLDLARDLVAVLPPGAGILPIGDTAVFACLYLKYCERERTDVQILAPAFGWRGEPVSAIFATAPLTDGVRETFPWLAGHRSVPAGLGHFYVRDDAQGAPPFAPLPREVNDGALLRDGADPFAEGLRATYAAYLVRLADRAAAAGRIAEAQRLFDRAERLNPADPYVSWLLAGAYREHGLRPERACALLAGARSGYASAVDPAAQRHYGVSPAEIERAWAQACGDPAPVPPPVEPLR